MSNVYGNYENECCSCPTATNSAEVINANIKNLEDNLCDMKVTLAETKAALLFLAQTLCNEGSLCEIEKTLLLNMDQSLKCLNCKINESKSNVDCLSCYLR